MAHFDYTLTKFTPAEAERITGVNLALQRDWRRRGILPTTGRHGRFDIIDLSMMRFLGCMAAAGIGPAVTRDYADIAAMGIARAALFTEGAATGDAYPGSPALFATSVLSATSPWPSMARVLSGPLFILFADGTEWWDFTVEHAIAQRADAPGAMDGPMIVLDTRVIGAAMTEKAGRPFVKVVRLDD